MSKTQAIAMSAVLLLLPGLYLTYVLVMMFVNHSESITTMLQITAGIGLFASVAGILYPVVCAFLAPSVPSSKSKLQENTDDADDDDPLDDEGEPESETFEAEDDWSDNEDESELESDDSEMEFETADDDFEPSGGLDGSVDLDSDIFMDDLESADEMPAAPSGDFESIEFDDELDSDSFSMFDDD